MKNFRSYFIGWWGLTTLIYTLPFFLPEALFLDGSLLGFTGFLHFGGGFGYFLLLLLPSLTFLSLTKTASSISKKDVIWFTILSIVGYALIALSALYYMLTCSAKLCDLGSMIFYTSPFIWLAFLLRIDSDFGMLFIIINNLIVLPLMWWLPQFLYRKLKN